MAQQLLQSKDVGPALQQVRSKTVPQPVRRDPLLDPCLARCAADRFGVPFRVEVIGFALHIPSMIYPTALLLFLLSMLKTIKDFSFLGFSTGS